MSIVQDLRTRARHRGKTPWQLVQTIGRLEREADVKDCELVALATENTELRAERNQLEADFDQAAIDYSAALQDCDEWKAEALALRAQLAPYKAREANANRIDVPAAVRDTSALEDQATQPIPVYTLQQAHGIGPVRDPGQLR